MLIYILAIPLFSFVLPLTSFWRMDDFTWCALLSQARDEADVMSGRGSTREVTGEKGKKIIVHVRPFADGPDQTPLTTIKGGRRV